MGSAEVVIPITMLLVKELVVKGSFRYGVRHFILIPLPDPNFVSNA
jgi:hypothetical protein